MKIFVDVIVRGLWFAPPQSKILAKLMVIRTEIFIFSIPNFANKFSCVALDSFRAFLDNAIRSLIRKELIFVKKDTLDAECKI